MAEFLKGTEIDFVKEMNKKVKALGLKNTQFKNCTGLDEEGHYSSAYDMAVIAKELLKHEEILKFSSKYEDYLRVNTPNKFWLVNTNKLVRFYEGAERKTKGSRKGGADGAGHRPLTHLALLASAASSSVVPIPGTFSWPLASRGKPRRGMLRRAVFSDVQRKALEKMFQKQKYISKPDRKKLAAKLGLKDSQVRAVSP